MADLIDRQAAIDAFDKELSAEHNHREMAVSFLGAKRIIETVPSAQTERKMGEWTKNNACQFCGYQPWFERDIHTLSFCPNCGADMKGEEE